MSYNENSTLRYDIYPCDLTWDGECPWPVQHCKTCRGWTQSAADAQIAREERMEQEFLALEQAAREEHRKHNHH